VGASGDRPRERPKGEGQDANKMQLQCRRAILESNRPLLATRQPRGSSSMWCSIQRQACKAQPIQAAQRLQRKCGRCNHWHTSGCGRRAWTGVSRPCETPVDTRRPPLLKLSNSLSLIQIPPAKKQRRDRPSQPVPNIMRHDKGGMAENVQNGAKAAHIRASCNLPVKTPDTSSNTPSLAHEGPGPAVQLDGPAGAMSLHNGLRHCLKHRHHGKLATQYQSRLAA